MSKPEGPVTISRDIYNRILDVLNNVREFEGDWDGDLEVEGCTHTSPHCASSHDHAAAVLFEDLAKAAGV